MGYKQSRIQREALKKNPNLENYKFTKHHKETNNVMQVEKG